jgi:SAM-dependent methyltransferase
MLHRARARLGDEELLRLHDLQRPLEWITSGSLDVVVSSLALHYIQDWRPVLSEFHRVLKAGGRLVFSTHHPFADFVNFERPNYFSVEKIGDTWATSGARYDVLFWRRPLGVMVDDVIRAGFDLERIVEPTPGPSADLDEHDMARLTTKPWFLLIAARRVG